MLFVALSGFPGDITQEAVKQAKTDLFAARVMAAGPSVEALTRYAAPFTGKAVLGTPFGAEEAAVTPAGAVLAPCGQYRVWIRMFLPSDAGPVPVFDGSKRAIPDPRVPATEHLAFLDDMRWKQTTFVMQEMPGNDRLVIRLSCENRSGEHRMAGPILGFSLLERAEPPWVDREQIPKPAQVEPQFRYNAVALTGSRFLVPLPRLTGVTKGGLPEGWMSYRVPLARQPIAPGDTEEWVVTLSLFDESEPRAAFDIDRAWEETQQLWVEPLRHAAEYWVPEPGLNQLREMLLTQLLVTADGDTMPYGAFPSVYDKVVNGVEEGWCILALAEWGLLDRAKRLMDGTILTAENQDKANRHHQYRNGLQAMYAWRLYELSGDRIWLEIAVLRYLRAAAEWTRDQISEDPRGILPEYRYGGDIAESARALWPNATCWRGLRDTAMALSVAGEEGADGFAALADEYRARLLKLFREAPGRTEQPPFVPLSLEEAADQLPSPEYYQLFAPLVFETGIFGPKSDETRGILAFLDSTGRLQAGVPRFGAYGPAGIDAEYGYGLQLMRLRREERARFLLGVFGQIGLSCDPAFGTMPEVTTLLTSDELAQEQREGQERYFCRTTEPCSAGPGVTLLYLRRMFVSEERDDEDRVTGVLQLCPAIPARWFMQEKPFYVKELPTPMGQVTVQVTPSKGRIEYRFALEENGVVPLQGLRIRVPDRLKSVKVEGSTEVLPRKQSWIALRPAHSAVLTVEW
jgi:hypothetical protein